MIKQFLIPLLFILGTLTSCRTVSQTNTPSSEDPTPIGSSAGEAIPTATISSDATTTPSPTPEPPRVLSICMGQEPASLFVYGDTTAAAQGILQAIYDGPFDRFNGEIIPIILQRIPSLDNGGAEFSQVEVTAGELIVDNQGSLVTLGEGVEYRPSGCTNPDCALVYSGTEAVLMDELIVRFELLQDLTWSDGEALTAQDSVYAYQVVRIAFNTANLEPVRFARSYQLVDDLTVAWNGFPGYQGSEYRTFFFTPLPEHLYGNLAVEELFSAQDSSQTPLGWGPYQIDEWVRGDHITLSRNPNYFRAGEGLPHFDFLVYRFVPNPQDAVNAFDAGECDLIDQTALDESQYGDLFERQEDGDLSVLLQLGTAWEQLTIGIQSLAPGRPDYFGQTQVRQAVAQCVDREAIAAAAFPIDAQIPSTYVMPGHPLFNPNVETHPFDPSAAQELLQAAGWVDLDNDPVTPRTALSVPGVPDGMPFEVTYLVPDDDVRPQIAQQIAASLAECGIGVNVSPMPMEELFAPGPEGPVFGRQFDLVQFAWISSTEPSCDLYTTGEIPGPYPDFPKSWGGGNAAGFSNELFDEACYQGLYSLPDDPSYIDGHNTAQLIFSQELPALPLYQLGKIAVARPDLCGVDLVSGINIVWWHLEDIDYGEGCTD